MLTAIIITACLLAAVTFYDFTWSNVTNQDRNAVVFDGRNHSYGAYALRVEYGRVVIISFTGVTLLVAGFLYTSRYMHQSRNAQLLNFKIDRDYIIGEIEDRNKPVEIPDTRVKPTETQRFDVKQYLNPTAIDDKKVDNAKTQKEMEDAIAGKKDIKGDSTAGKDVVDNPDVKKTIAPPCLDCAEPLSIVQLEELPELEGLKKFLKNNLDYKRDAIEAGIKGTVWVEFVVNRDGSISDVRIKKGVHAVLDNESLRVMKMMPSWKPGKINGNAVRVRLVQPITFGAK